MELKQLCEKTMRLFGEGWKPCFVDFPSIKEGETINIDEELERNGMHR